MMINVLSAASALVVGPTTNHGASASYGRRAAEPLLAVDSWYDSGVRLLEPAPQAASVLADDIWKTSKSVAIQGGSSLKTWKVGGPTERVQLSIKGTRYAPIEVSVELWYTPGYIPTRFRIYTQDGLLRPVDAVIETSSSPKTVALYNMGPVEFPFDANVISSGVGRAEEALAGVEPDLVQGAGQITTYEFGPEVESVQILLKTRQNDFRAKVELTQGPNQVKQYIEVDSSEGRETPFYVVMQTPGAMSTIRVINQASVEFPIDAWVLPYRTASAESVATETAVVMGGGSFGPGGVGGGAGGWMSSGSCRRSW